MNSPAIDPARNWGCLCGAYPLRSAERCRFCGRPRPGAAGGGQEQPAAGSGTVGTGGPTVPTARTTLPTVQEAVGRRGKAPNKAETEFRKLFLDQRLMDGEIFQVGFNAWTVLLGPDCRYTPDWTYFDGGGRFHCVEVKGAHVWDDGKVKFRTAVQAFPMIVWTWAQRKQGGEWNVQYFNQAAGRLDIS
jgi:hypothetical protein